MRDLLSQMGTPSRQITKEEFFLYLSRMHPQTSSASDHPSLLSPYALSLREVEKHPHLGEKAPTTPCGLLPEWRVVSRRAPSSSEAAKDKTENRLDSQNPTNDKRQFAPFPPNLSSSAPQPYQTPNHSPRYKERKSDTLRTTSLFLLLLRFPVSFAPALILIKSSNYSSLHPIPHRRRANKQQRGENRTLWGSHSHLLSGGGKIESKKTKYLHTQIRIEKTL